MTRSPTATSTAQGGGAAPVPTLSGWALAVMILLLGSLGYFVARVSPSGWTSPGQGSSSALAFGAEAGILFVFPYSLAFRTQFRARRGPTIHGEVGHRRAARRWVETK